MIVSRQKSMTDILSALAASRSVFIIGCAKCATVCKSGGEEEVWQMQEKLLEQGKTVSGSLIIDEVCHILRTQRDLRAKKEQVDEAEAILVLSCGAGVQSVSSATTKRTVAGADTLFLGNIRRFGQFEQKCSLCGHCMLNDTGGLCPTTLCSKGLLNGPCGGMNNGRCEIDENRECGWCSIYERLKNMGMLHLLHEMAPPQSEESMPKPRHLKLEKDP